MKKFIKKSFIFLIPVILIVALTNYLVDPAHIFNDDYEKGMVEIIKDGNNIANIGNYDERLFQKIYIEQLKKPNGLIVIGSSRSMQIREELFNDSFFNNSVSGSTLEDYIAITQLYVENNKLPPKIILCVDPWIFNKNHGQERWETLKEYYQKFLKHNNLDDESIIEKSLPNNLFENNIAELFSIKYFQESIRFILTFSFNDDYFSTKKKALPFNVKLNDGSLVYKSNFRNAGINEINNKAKNYIYGNIYSIEKFSSINERYRDQFEALINFYGSKNVDVVLLLSPYHPIVYNYITKNKEYRMVKKVEGYLNEFANKSNVEIFGSYNPKKLDLNSDSFYDGMHPKEEVMEKLFN
jgi:hypothetical protein